MEKAGLIDRDAGPGRAELLSAAAGAGAQWDDASGRYYQAKIACPFLEGGACSVYAERPMVCREYYVTTPVALCEALAEGIRGVPRPVRMDEAVTDLTNEALGRDDMAIPLPLALEWASVNREAFDAEGDGEELAMGLVRAIQAADAAEARKG
jgi:Fe-S-cluster containining protein